MYLPQFHRVEENDLWWGEGFTEWVAVKSALPLFEGHEQPKTPYNNQYYDLSDKAVMEWQAKLRKEYQIDGFCFYHYWFKNGKRILEKPAENLLKWEDIDIPFCFCWANETWAKTWSNLLIKNTWADKFESQTDRMENHGILLQQAYGREVAWKEHFNYLLSFFKDSRYIKHNGAPIFMIYRPQQIRCLDEMAKYWNELAVENGFTGVYFIVGNSDPSRWDYINAGFQIEPKYTRETDENEILLSSNQGRGPKEFSYEQTWNKILARKNRADKPTYMGAFVNYDDTPRHSERGAYYSGASAEKFENYFSELLVKAQKEHSEYVFINAWNEWGEGMYLEPDQKNNLKFLEAISKAKTNLRDSSSQDSSSQDSSSLHDNEMHVRDRHIENSASNKIAKMSYYYSFMSRWMGILEYGYKLQEFFEDSQYDSIVIYGCGPMGKHLVRQLARSKVQVKAFIDKSAPGMYQDIEIVASVNEIGKVDAIVVTPILEYCEIKNKLKEAVDCPIISLEEVLGYYIDDL